MNGCPLWTQNQQASIDCRGLLSCQVSSHSDQGFSFYMLSYTPTCTHTHTHTHTYRDKVIAISASPYYVVSADNQLDALECNITRATSTLKSGSAHICELSCWSQTDWQTERFVDNYDSNDRIIFFGQLRTAHASTEATYFQGCNL